MKKILYLVFALMLCGSMQAQIDINAQPKQGPAPKINLKKPQTFKLPNGLTVMVVENHKLPSVSFTLTLDNPLSLEGQIKGIESLTGSMMGNGTSKISKDDFNKKIESYGANVDFNIRGMDGSTLSRYFKEVFTLATQGVLDPLFTQDELQSERAKMLDNLKANDKNTRAIAGRVSSALIYGKQHPKGEFATEESINKITLANVQNCYKTYFVPGNAYLVVVGDVKFDEVKTIVTNSFAKWKAGVASKSIFKDPVNLTQTEIDFVDVPSAVQSEISLNNVVTLKMTSPDYFAALLANQILGGGGEGRLFLNLREAHGWTYGAYSSISGNKHVTTFSASSSVRSNVTDSAIVEIMNEVKKIRTTLPTQADLDLAKAKYIGNFVMNAEKPETVASFALREKTQMLPPTFYSNFIQNINAVTLDQVKAAAHKYILEQGTRIIVAGKASDILPKLEAMNIPIKYYDKSANPTEKPEAKAVDTSVTPQSILNKYIEKVGGKSALEGVKTIEVTAKAKVQGQEMTFLSKQTNTGNNFNEISIMGMTIMKSVINGDKGYVTMQGNKKEMSAEELADTRENIFEELKLISSSSVKVTGIEKINGNDAYKLVEGKKAYFYDVKSGLKVAQEVTVKANGTDMTQRMYISDYKPLKGVLVPFKTSMNMMGMDIDQIVSEIKINEGVSDTDFQ